MQLRNTFTILKIMNNSKKTLRSASKFMAVKFNSNPNRLLTKPLQFPVSPNSPTVKPSLLSNPNPQTLKLTSQIPNSQLKVVLLQIQNSEANLWNLFTET
ncbi:hypothetical protein C1637_08045 [Chryseobacterium lactis]|uniref:Uncharacterized protein n=1 Tax=Chryseobacterium lactis TaxID=1241981 RepID=A0A3G6RMX8_CHRLC|nr:hypothetical protein EG342_11650 [Chryseobacterium lactis]AZB02890.1 hypothetical protein EG341_02510 [Chryseobacterium lactis]PNW13815.1 hypothetical protein C1637_08045 [Chryseobacterium lactis]